jgi:GDPmannose 4,6-dehydratase
MNAQRDWGYAGDYVKAMYLMLQQDKPDDYVISTGETHSIRDFLEIAANHLDMELTYSGSGVDEKIYDQNGKMIGRINPIHFRPTEVDLLLGDSTKAKKVLKWEPEFSFKELVKMMVKSDYDKVIKGIKLQ